MPNKLQNINDLAMATTLQITSSPDDWMDFLDTASANYKYSFNDQVLIFAQKPNATACADINTWNTRLHRWIKKGSKGIALVQNNGYGNSLRHVFDISDTYDKFGRSHTFDKNINNVYDKENRKNLEGGNVNGENHISQRLRLSDTRLNSENKAASELGQIRNNNREISTKEIRTDSNETSRTESSKREDETRKSNAWVGLMNNFKNQAEEIIYQEIIYN